ncbi:A disintegrin and metalloproteinase with thrombospondin motifs 20 [Elysia marginata]|uniref:A disintegrin and metalloproteinase with thrombospondin motifs 20 n=1 Tax=Elysia marginata TaxID=1093978 RepID=A0AAV4GCJ5_9GAST|nr:A disintegrin and metalloproteinase with thrombospondin motifs 20 [Elysia marginata]
MPVSMRACTGDECPYWTAGNWGECSVTCGNGWQRRRLYCQVTPRDESEDAYEVSQEQCSEKDKPEDMQACRQRACRPQEVRLRADCERRRYGCCPDGRTPARGPRYYGCPGRESERVTPRPSCERQSYGCCPDGRTPARGPRYYGCPDRVTTGDGKSFCSCL